MVYLHVILYEKRVMQRAAKIPWTQIKRHYLLNQLRTNESQYTPDVFKYLYVWLRI